MWSCFRSPALAEPSSPVPEAGHRLEQQLVLGATRDVGKGDPERWCDFRCAFLLMILFHPFPRNLDQQHLRLRFDPFLGLWHTPL